ncbi:MAG: DnaJ domain-containing protein [Proteobacteria bacterium]|nr:DnaJ domain-containing protein [Pseudomonadota bacterium]
MSDKPDYYEVLGVNKSASPDEIKKAHKKIAMTCHPDMVRNKSDAEKKVAAEKFKWATEAIDVLSDPIKRNTYDQYGHAGVENLKGSGPATSSGSSHDTPPKKREVYTDDNTFEYFTKKAEEQKSTDGQPRKTAEQRAAEAAEARRKAREAQRQNPSSTNNSGTPSVTDTFKDVANKVGDATDRLKGAVIPLDILQKFRDNLQSFINEVDTAIERSRKSGGPDNKL